MSRPIKSMTVVPGVGAWTLDEYQLLAQLGVAHRRKRYSKIFYVNAEDGNDAAPGTAFDIPVKTLSKALGLCTTAYGDFVIIEPSASNLTEDSVSVSKADLTIVSMADPTGGQGVIRPATLAATGLSLTAAADNLYLKRLMFDTTVSKAEAVLAASGASYLTVDECVFYLTGAAGPTGYGVNFAATSQYPRILNSIFLAGTLVNACLIIRAGTTGGLVKGCKFVNLLNASGTGTANAINVMAGTGVVIEDCHINGGPSATAYNFDDGIDIDAGTLNTMIVNCTIGNCDAGVTNGDTTSSTSGATAGEGWVDTTTA